MDTQLKRGFLEVCVLTAIRKQDSYGYQIIKEVPSYLGLTESTLYPLLKRLESAHALTVYSVEHNSRLRKYYHITDEGIQQIDDFLEEWNDIMSVYEYVKRGAK
jgi:PadR family transcriptional regulator, regulatory protein PadR